MDDDLNKENEKLIREYEEIFLVIRKYQTIIPKIVKSMDLDKINQLSKEHPFYMILINFNWQIYSLSDSVIMMNSLNRYNEASLFLRTMMETTLLLQYLNQFPQEAKRWLEFQDLWLLKFSKKDEYQRYISLDYPKFIRYLQEKGYGQVIQHINKRNFRKAKKFDPGFIRQFVDHERFFTDGTNYQQRQGSNALYDILSKYSHPSFVVFEGPYKDIEIELENIKIALNFVDVICKLFCIEFKDFLPKEMTFELKLLNLCIVKIFDKKQYDSLIDRMMDSDISKETLEKIKNDGLMEQPYKKGMRIQFDASGPLDKELSDEYILEMDTNKEVMERFLLMQSTFYSISDNIKKIYRSIDEEKLINAGKDRWFLNILSSFHRVISCFIDSIIMVNHYKKYSEASSLLRYIIESTFIVQYLYQYPTEVKRWLELQDMFVLRHTKGQDNRGYMNTNLSQFKKYLMEKGYSEVVNEINQSNYEDAKWFSPSFIRKMVDYKRLFHTDDKSMNDTIRDLYDIESKHIHPSVRYFFLKNKRDLKQEVDIITIAYSFFDVFNEILLTEYGELVPKDMKNNVESLIEKANKIIFP